LILRRREAPSRRMRRPIPLPSCFETHRSALRRAKQPALASRCDAPREGSAAHFGQTNPTAILANPRIILAKRSRARVRVLVASEGPTFGCTKSPPAPFYCFRIVIYNGFCNSRVSVYDSSVTATHDSGRLGPGRWVAGLKRTRLVLAAAALAFGALWALGAIAAGPALAGFALVAAAVVIATAKVDTAPARLPRDEPSAARLGDPLIEAGVGAVPDARERESA